jgi:hypothetical protein
MTVTLPAFTPVQAGLFLLVPKGNHGPALPLPAVREKVICQGAAPPGPPPTLCASREGTP